MQSQIDLLLARPLARWVGHAHRRPGPIIALCVAITLASGFYAATHLGINSDNVRMVGQDVPSRRNHEAFAKLFPNLENALLVVVDGDTPELAREASTKLVEAIGERTDHFTSAYLAGGGTFFETHGLLYRSAEELDAFGDQMARLQPILAALEQDASIANLAELVSLGLEQSIGDAEGGGISPDDWAFILDSVGQATVSVYSEFPLALSWEQMLLRGSAVEVTKRHVIVVHPILDFDSILPAGVAMAQIREIAAERGYGPEQGVRVRITGNPALNTEEMIGIAWDLGLGGVFCFLLVIAALTRALRSFKLVVAAVATLLVGLVWTAAFAAAAIGHLSLVSASFAVLFIGLGVDFGIHLGMAYAAQLRAGSGHEEAIREAVAGVGGSLVICTFTTIIGFYVFIPTDYLGVAELGLIAGTGMLIILTLTLSLFPALLSRWLRPDAERDLARELHFRTTWWRVFDTHPALVVSVAALLGAGAIALLPGARFDVNVIAMRDPTTESVQAFDDLLAQSGALSPWYIDSVAPDLEQAEARAARMGQLDVVSHTLTLADFVPPDQEEKLEILADVAFMMDTQPLSLEEKSTPFETQVAALRQLRDFLSEDWLQKSHSSLAESVRVLRSKLGSFLDRIDRDQDPKLALAKLDELLLSGLPDQMTRLRRAVNTGGITLEDLPPELVERMIAKDGQARIQVFPKHDLSEEAEFTRFTDEVQRIDPKAAGVAINLVGFGRAVRSSFRQALLSAVSIVSLLLLVLWRELRPMLLVMAPLALASLLTVAGMVLLDLPFNFGNVIVIPLLLGIGVDSGIHLVHRAQHLKSSQDDLMDSTTARAVFYSALTTTISFGTLALSSHRGLASLGVVLSLGMMLTVMANLIVLPAMLRLGGLAKPRAAGD